MTKVFRALFAKKRKITEGKEDSVRMATEEETTEEGMTVVVIDSEEKTSQRL